MDPDTDVLPGPASSSRTEGAHAIAALSGEPGIASVPAPPQVPRLLPPAADRLVTGLARTSCHDASGLAVLMSAGLAGLPGLSRLAAPAAPVARLAEVPGSAWRFRAGRRILPVRRGCGGLSWEHVSRARMS